jgi:hypothetical protein
MNTNTSESENTVRKCLNCEQVLPNDSIEVFCCFACNHGYKTRIFKLFHEQFQPTLRSLE